MVSRSTSNDGRKVSRPPCSSPPAVSAARRPRSAPAQNALSPVPPITTEPRSGSAVRRAVSSSHSSALRALRRSGLSRSATPTSPVRSQRTPTSGLVDQCDQIALLHDVLGLDVELPHDARDLGHDRDLHLHRLEDDELVSLGDHLALVDTNLPDVGGDLRSDLVHGAERSQTGRTPCLRHGRSTCLSRASCKPRQTAWRVSAGSITSSTSAWPAATYGSMFLRISSASSSRFCGRSSSGTSSRVRRWMMLTAPSGPMTAISAVGQATR